jgi:alkanesulfonate monooxygenase SsuD/methylene tetrahydromethanopterin reductase-like flavin-dependent oxidoreductase (luciferase family)
MEVGLLFTFRNPPKWARPADELYAETLDEVELADRLGFDAVWLAEHHFTDDGWTPAILPVAGAVAVKTRRVRIGTFVLLLPQHDPLRIAEAATAVDILSGGRLILGLGLGYRAEEETKIGLAPSTRGSRMDEGLEVLVRCLEEESVNFKGRWYTLSDVTLTPRPVQHPRPPIIVAGLGERSLKRAARLGCDGLAVYPPRVAYDQLTELLQGYGRDVQSWRFYTIVLGYVGASDDDSWTTVGPHATWVWEHYRAWLLAAGQSNVFTKGPRDDFIIGDKARWMDAIAAMVSNNPGVPCHHVVVELVMAGMSHRARIEGIERFATEVMPFLHDLEGVAATPR